MAEAAVSYTNAKTAMTKAGLPVSVGPNWTNVDVASWQKFIHQSAYFSGSYTVDQYKANYGFAYASEMPQHVTDAVAAENYTATMAAAPLTGAHPLLVTFTTTETNATGQSFSWNFGDGTAPVITNTPTTTHTYQTAGTYTAHVTSTVNGLVEPTVTAGAPVVVS
jgi:PKD repeat protein